MLELKTKSFKGQISVKDGLLWAYVVKNNEVIVGTNFKLNSRFSEVLNWLNNASLNYTQQSLNLFEL